MPAHKLPPSTDNPEQSRRFIETAREVETDESADAMDRAFEKVIKKINKIVNPANQKPSPDES